MKNKWQFSKGFTLIELLIVISIIGILSSLLMSNFISAQQRGRDAQRKSDLKQIQAALEQYKADNGHYPCSNGGWEYSYQSTWLSDYVACGSGYGLNGADAKLSPTYISRMPVDPINTNAGGPFYNSLTGAPIYLNYAYWSGGNIGSTCVTQGSYYLLVGILENRNDTYPDTNAQIYKVGGAPCGTWYTVNALQNVWPPNTIVLQNP